MLLAAKSLLYPAHPLTLSTMLAFSRPLSWVPTLTRSHIWEREGRGRHERRGQMKPDKDKAEQSRPGVGLGEQRSGGGEGLRGWPPPAQLPPPSGPHSLVSVVSYWLSRCSSKMSTSTRALAGTSMIPLICSRARARARRSPRPHTVWSSRIAAEGTQGLGTILQAGRRG